ncbi:hypothetical protein AXG93_285s1300 [Marchantia polymorpha subsp. ruderalis]|uniref:Uncharacterized protein n=1 Tax=Marchantia polymorpha subsp. ruderalis TaxID=1480154 RepID=A0A176VSV3_MARPO|nr:hypothetical protein AXG93_285s1300 [Marchantia polymorpha subsp. ruderalis]
MSSKHATSMGMEWQDEGIRLQNLARVGVGRREGSIQSELKLADEACKGEREMLSRARGLEDGPAALSLALSNASPALYDARHPSATAVHHLTEGEDGVGEFSSHPRVAIPSAVRSSVPDCDMMTTHVESKKRSVWIHL